MATKYWIDGVSNSRTVNDTGYIDVIGGGTLSLLSPQYLMAAISEGERPVVKQVKLHLNLRGSGFFHCKLLVVKAASFGGVGTFSSIDMQTALNAKFENPKSEIIAEWIARRTDNYITSADALSYIFDADKSFNLTRIFQSQMGKYLADLERGITPLDSRYYLLIYSMTGVSVTVTVGQVIQIEWDSLDYNRTRTLTKRR
jgi:hypothetical protein